MISLSICFWYLVSSPISAKLSIITLTRCSHILLTFFLSSHIPLAHDCLTIHTCLDFKIRVIHPECLVPEHIYTDKHPYSIFEKNNNNIILYWIIFQKWLTLWLTFNFSMLIRPILAQRTLYFFPSNFPFWFGLLVIFPELDLLKYTQ